MKGMDFYISLYFALLTPWYAYTRVGEAGWGGGCEEMLVFQKIWRALFFL